VSSGGLGASELRLITAPHQQEGFTLCVYVVFSVLFCDGEMVTHPEIRVKFSTPYPCTGVTSSASQSAWSHVSGGSPKIRLIFVFICEVSCKSL
jgi:hypothetical protein